MGSRKQGEETNRLVLGVVKAHGAISTNEIAKLLQRPDASIREACRRLEAKGYLHGECVKTKDGRKGLWRLSDGPINEAATYRVRSVLERDNWVPQPWVHPIRARALGLSRPPAPRE